MTWDTSVPILVFLGLSVLELGQMSDRQSSNVRRTSSLYAPYPRGRGIINTTTTKPAITTTTKLRSASV